MDFDDIKGKISDWFESVKTGCVDFWENTQRYFQSLDQWEWVGWGGEAIGLILVVVSLVFW